MDFKEKQKTLYYYLILNFDTIKWPYFYLKSLVYEKIPRLKECALGYLLLHAGGRGSKNCPETAYVLNVWCSNYNIGRQYDLQTFLPCLNKDNYLFFM